VGTKEGVREVSKDPCIPTAERIRAVSKGPAENLPQKQNQCRRKSKFITAFSSTLIPF